MWREYYVCGPRRSMKIFVRVLSERWKSLEREYDLMFDGNLLC